MKNKVICIGELLIDFIPVEKGIKLKDVLSFKRAAGGAPANVACAVAKLGGKSAMISQIGFDAFGEHILETLNKFGVDTDYVFKTDKANTGLAFVSLSADGNRDFSFYRNPSADLFLSENQIKESMFDDCSILHFCSVDLVNYPVKKAHIKAIETAKKKGLIVSFDPNIRLPLWNSENECKSAVNEFIPYADIIKISDDELEFITGFTSPKDAAEYLFKKGCKIFLYTKGSKGSELFTKNYHIKKPVINVNVIDATGAGDSFIGAFLYKLVNNCITMYNLDTITEENLSLYMDFAVFYSAYTTTKKGAAAAMATKTQIEEFIKTR